IHDFIHLFNVVGGLCITVLTTEYSLLLLNTSIVEFLSIIFHLLLDGRIFTTATSTVCMAAGPCRLVSDTFCMILGALVNMNMIHSITIIAVSFWYRLRVLRGEGLVGKLRLQLICLLLFVPHLVYLVAASFAADDPRELEPIVDAAYHDGYASNYTLYGFVDLAKPLTGVVISYLAVFPICCNVYIIYVRSQVSAL
ncbi:hypothetical protein PFISCL1PPCAC_13761, partial [Pristionchus fissidentatus]